MNRQLTAAMIGGLMLAIGLGVPAWARTDADEARLITVQKEIDSSATAPGQTTRVQTLATQFNVAPGVVQDLRAKKQGWGEITIELAMAQRLAQTDPKAYPTLMDALAKIETLRAEKTGWGKIANDLGFKLGPVVSAAQRAGNELRRESRTTGSPKPEEAAMSERPARPDMGARPSRPERPERPARAH
jgi:hypothetical protein